MLVVYCLLLALCWVSCLVLLVVIMEQADQVAIHCMVVNPSSVVVITLTQ